jgi:tRNA(Ile)-lysidine synthase
MVAQLNEKALDSIHRYGLIASGDTLICALSGGPDSVCMIHLLADLRRELRIEMILAHVNYQTRGEESRLDEDLCRAVAEKLSLPIAVKSLRQTELSRMLESNFQSEARKFRYAYFEQLCLDRGANKIAVGHTADDVAETTLMHFLRGSGVTGLAGIYPQTGRTIRPLIDCSREEISAYLDLRGIEYRIDKSNLEAGYFRNRVRNDLIPHLEEKYNSRIRQCLSRTARLARATDQFMMSHVDQLWDDTVRRSRLGKICVNIGKYAAAEDIIRYGLMRKAHRSVASSDRSKKSLDYELVENADSLIDQDVGRRADLKNGLMVERGYDELIIFRDETISFSEELQLPGSYSSVRFCLGISGEIEDIAEERPGSSDNLAVGIDFERISAPYVVRTFENGDRVKLLNAPGTRKVSDIFVDRKIPRSLRAEIPVVTAGGNIVWIVGIGIADDVKVTNQTKKVLKLSAKPGVI